MLLAQLVREQVQVLRQQELEQAQVLVQVQALRPQEQAPEQLVPAQQHHSQPPRQQSLFQRARCHLPAREFPSAFRQSVMALRYLLCLLTPQTMVRQLLQHHPHF